MSLDGCIESGQQRAATHSSLHTVTYLHTIDHHHLHQLHAAADDEQRTEGRLTLQILFLEPDLPTLHTVTYRYRPAASRMSSDIADPLP